MLVFLSSQDVRRSPQLSLCIGVASRPCHMASLNPCKCLVKMITLLIGKDTCSGLHSECMGRKDLNSDPFDLKAFLTV